MLSCIPAMKDHMDGAARFRFYSRWHQQQDIVWIWDREGCQKSSRVKHLPLEVDVSKDESVKKLNENAIKHYSVPPRIIVNCAGITRCLTSGYEVFKRRNDAEEQRQPKRLSRRKKL